MNIKDTVKAELISILRDWLVMPNGTDGHKEIKGRKRREFSHATILKMKASAKKRWAKVNKKK